MDRSITDLPPTERKRALEAIDGELQGLLQSHGVSEDVQVAIGLSPCNTCPMFAEFFTDDSDSSKTTIKTDGPKIFKFESMEGLPKKTECPRLALVWRGASMAAKHHAEALSQPASRASAMVITSGLREALCKAYQEKFGAGEQPPAKLQGCDDLLGWIYKDFSSSVPGCYSLTSAVSLLMRHASRKPPSASGDDSAKNLPSEEFAHRGPINSRDKFRDALAILFTSMLMVVAALPNKPKIQLTLRQSRKWQQHIDGLADSKPRPSLRILINGEFLGRQKAIALTIDDGMIFGEALDEVRRDPSFWNQHVHRPAEGHEDELEDGDLQARTPLKRPRERSSIFPRFDWISSNTMRNGAKGKASGKGKHFSRSTSTVPPEFHGKALRAPPSWDFPAGQQICFDYHLRGRCSCSGHRSHACPNRKAEGFCFGNHRMTSCPGSG
eukprot:TRINITY_DN9916_c0_g1_i1.p1 TRINITY_DN9916_c0_g1~~TRINITY_DN9916_c0_g1_i1.p1  ORF type:complete len:478 (+),score=58.01 TRINITY_DN9916_c0_g1_i1:117-1436(+)